MKYTSLLSLALVAPVLAGTSGKEVIPPPAPVEPSLTEWFAGGSVGYLTEFEEPMYHLHIGQQTGHQIGGWDLAWYLEVGYTDKDESYSRGTTSTPPTGIPQSYDLDELETFLATNAAIGTWGYDLEIIPVTINGMLQRPLSGNLDCYVGAGLGVSNVDLSIDAGPLGSLSDDDWVFTFQASAGLIYNFTPDFEAYSGARWIYWDDADIGPGTLELEDDLLLELGLRFDF